MKNADSDTNDSMTVGLLGAIHGLEWVNEEWLKVQDYNYIQKLAHNLDLTPYEGVKETVCDERANKKTKDRLSSINVGDKIQIGPFNTMELVEIIENRTFTKNLSVKTAIFKSDEGQSIFIKHMRKIDPKVEEITSFDSNNKLAERHLYNLTAEQLVDLSQMFPSRFTMKKGLELLSFILNDLNHLKSNEISARSLEEFAEKHVVKGIEPDDIKKIINYLIK